jgi:hypothetical protein
MAKKKEKVLKKNNNNSPQGALKEGRRPETRP